ncbi:Ribonuclease inhibitor [Seminavis robusta]|uniref:Ribonuclease inhibitor n=1 Tax=Seminavis robusta TaxID=568900 RepID=A0A9N8DFV3_9STRA|nr:Ribonuclease inhibitor [Seminavis robusta]|eukprot:Sro137_g064490.1 Ribonuclease inhibitor (458) ;mRNA; r:82138-83848
MSAWGANAKSCKSLLDRVERNDAGLTELFILPTKTFGGEEVDRLAQIIENGINTHLKKLSASGHKVPNESLYKLGKAIASAAAKKTAAPTSLAIGDHTLGHTGILAFTKGIRECGGITDLEDIDWSWKGIGSSAFEMILEVCGTKSSPKLRVLNLSRNESIGEQSTENLSFAAFLTHLQVLDLSTCGLSGDFLTQFLVTPKGVQPNLKQLNLHDNPIGATGWKAILPLMTRDSSCLEVLNLSKCQIDNDAMSELSTWSSKSSNSNLRILDLSDNELSAAGIEILSKELSVFPNLVELNLAGNAIGEQGVQQLAMALEARHTPQQQGCCCPLKKLDLSRTQCGHQGAMDMISRGRLQSLHLFHNELGSDGFTALASTLQGGHATLEYLDLGGNGAKQDAVVELLNALTNNPMENSCLKVLVVGGNEGGDGVEEAAARVGQVHPALDIARDKKAQRQAG